MWWESRRWAVGSVKWRPSLVCIMVSGAKIGQTNSECRTERWCREPLSPKWTPVDVLVSLWNKLRVSDLCVFAVSASSLPCTENIRCRYLCVRRSKATCACWLSQCQWETSDLRYRRTEEFFCHGWIPPQYWLYIDLRQDLRHCLYVDLSQDLRETLPMSRFEEGPETPPICWLRQDLRHHLCADLRQDLKHCLCVAYVLKHCLCVDVWGRTWDTTYIFIWGSTWDTTYMLIEAGPETLPLCWFEAGPEALPICRFEAGPDSPPMFWFETGPETPPIYRFETGPETLPMCWFGAGLETPTLHWFEAGPETQPSCWFEAVPGSNNWHFARNLTQCSVL